MVIISVIYICEIIAASLMGFAGLIGYFLGIDSEGKSLEEISEFIQHELNQYLYYVEDLNLN